MLPLSELVELLVNQINTNKDKWLPPENKPVEAIPCIDWVMALRQTGLKVLVVPEVVQYNAGEDNAREWVKQVNTVKYVSILVGYTFESMPLNDTVAPWSECKMILDIHEDINRLVLETDYSDKKIAILEVESQPVDEQELDRRNFNATTAFGFEAIECSSRHELASTPLTSTSDFESPETRASLRRQALSARRLGRRLG